tara:strand:+ start:102 stop:965 length:864 start_codon:yes stop_codon:yes gene_type:complete
MSEQIHKQILEDVMDSFDERFESASKVLENKIAKRILATTTVDELLELRLDIDRDFQDIILNSIREFMPELDIVARDTILNTSGVVTPTDNRVAAELKAQAYDRLKEQVNTAKSNVNTEIVVGALGGYALSVVAQSAAHAISGFFITTSDVETTRLQNKIKRLRAASENKSEEINDLMKNLKKRFQNVSVGGGMYQSVSAEAHDTVMDFDGVFTIHRARQAGIKRFKYSGSLVAKSRDFCINHVGNTYTEAEVRDIWSSQSWSGKRVGDPFVVRGGHRCRHFFIPVE